MVRREVVMRFKAVVFVLLLYVLLGCSTISSSNSASPAQPAPGVTALGDGIYQVRVRAITFPTERFCQELLVCAAKLTLANDRSYFRILDSWYFYEQANAQEAILIRFTDDANDMSAQWVIRSWEAE
jgi:hypothetical protein